jgi:hypothetical protein
MKMAISGNDPYTISYNTPVWNISTAASGQTWTLSVYAKASVAITGQLFIFGADSSGTVFTYVDYGATTVNITTEWTRVTFSYTFSNANVASVQFRLDGPDSGGTGANIWWDGVQLEQASSASAFNPMKNTNRANLLDVSGNNNHHTIIGSPTFSNGRFTLNGTSQWFSRLASMNGVTTNCTVTIWYSTTDAAELWVRGNQSGSYYLSASSGGNYYNSNCGSPTNYVDLALTANPTTPINYRNGNFHMWEATGVDFVTVPWTSYEWFGYADPWLLSGTVSAIMVYNRVLTASESAQNYAAYRGRYGI